MGAIGTSIQTVGAGVWGSVHVGGIDTSVIFVECVVGIGVICVVGSVGVVCDAACVEVCVVDVDTIGVSFSIRELDGLGTVGTGDRDSRGGDSTVGLAFLAAESLDTVCSTVLEGLLCTTRNFLLAPVEGEGLVATI